MKKMITLLLLTLITISCSSDDSNTNNATVTISPPDWIQGKYTGLHTPGGIGYRFTSNDFCDDKDCWRAAIESTNALIPNEADQVKVIEISTDKTYTIIMSTSGVETKRYEFRRKSNIELVWTNAPGYSEANIDYFTYLKQ